MRYYSSIDSSVTAGFLEAVLQGMAPDGGLYLPDFSAVGVSPWVSDYAEFAAAVLSPFCQQDLGRAETLAIARRAFHFPVQMREITPLRYQLELFHGPSLSFKDFGAQFLSQVLATTESEKKRLVMVATSGDTGSAVAAAFHGAPNVQVTILYPKGKVSARQAHQLACWGDNIQTLAVEGTFDDCQKLVKSCFGSAHIQEHFQLTTANSINIGRLLPQVVYYAYSSLWCERLHNKPMNVIIPTGNCGHLTAACWARELGYPIEQIVAAQNANHPLVDYHQTGLYDPKPSVETLANAMDVGAPSNFARLRALYGGWEQFQESLSAYSVTDEQIKQSIVNCYEQTQVIICPHTATAFYGLPSIEDDPCPWVMVATAHPAKFAEIVEPLIGEQVPLPVELEQQLARSATETVVAADLTAILDLVQTYEHDA